MSTIRPFANNTLATFVYEPFSYTISNPAPGTYTLTTSNSSGILSSYIANNGSNVIFSAASNGMSTGTEYLTITAKDGSGNTVATSSNTVTIGSGRFLDAPYPSGVPYDGRIFQFYKNEPIAAMPLVAPFAISTPTSVPTLPPGLTYTSNASNSFSITGTPLVTIPQSNYLVIGKATGSNLGKIVTSQFGLSVSNERVVMNLDGTSIVSPMTVGSAISPRTITSRFPPYPSGGTLRYTWAGLPDGITVSDASGTVRSSPFTPVDSSFTIVIQGTPTIAAANAYRSAGISSNLVTFTATRTNPLPVISNTEAITFRFGETVLFDSVTVPTLYSGVTIDPSATFFQARTYFGSDSSISTIFSPDLRSDLSINFIHSQGRGYLFGTPTSTGSTSYTIRAINSNAVSRDLSVPITVASDIVTFVSPTPNPVDTCFNFVLSRPISTALSGYYPSNIQFKAVAASGKPVTFTTSSFTGTGLSLDVSSGIASLIGVPETVTPLTTATITASAVGTPATATTTFKYAILNDDISFSQPTASQLSFIQNRAITPIQLSATTLSERQVISYTSANLPSGLAISTTGRITGTPTVGTSGTFTVTASTGYMNQNQTYSYAITPDTILFNINPNIYTYDPGANVSIDVDAVTYSGISVSNYSFSNFTQSYGLSLDSSTGIISGTLVDGLPPNVLLPASSNFYVNASAGSLDASLTAVMVTTNPVVFRSFLLNYSFGVNPTTDRGLYIDDTGTLSNWTTAITGDFSSFQKKNTSVDSNTYILCKGTYGVLRSTDGVNWTSNVDFPLSNGSTAYTSWNVSNSSNWYVAGTSYDLSNSVQRVYYFTSEDDGVTWTRTDGSTTRLRLASRRSDSNANWYTVGGVAFSSNSGVLLIGGGIDSTSGYMADADTAYRSTDGGSNWATVRNPFEVEVSTFNVDNSGVWVMAGSSYYSMGNYPDSSGYTVGAQTLKWSEDQGESWSNATGLGRPTVGTYEVAYASNTWLAAGMTFYDAANVTSCLVCSYNGKDWSTVTLPETFGAFTRLDLPEIGPIWSDGSNWKVFVKRNTSGAFPDTSCKIYTHSLSGDLTTGWTADVSGITPFSSGLSTLPGFNQNYVRLGQPTKVTIGFDSLPAGGPIITSPTRTSFLFYQYVEIEPIQFTASGTGTLYYFVESAGLPKGITFDPLTATLSGRSVELGQTSFSVYVKDDVGVTRVIVTTNTIIPTVTRQQTSAGAWTSLIRQYTVVNAAQNSVNGRTLPATEPPLGEFMRPQPPDSTSAPGDPNCVKRC